MAIADLPKAGTLGVPDPGLLLLLIPDGLAVSDPGVGAWIDAASEIGVRLQPVTDSQFLAMGSNTALQYAGLVLPDTIHAIGSTDIVNAVKSYTSAGGKTMLTFDFAALELNANNVPVFPIPKSRLSDMAGVDYVLYDKYLDQTTGLGPVTAMRSTMRELLVVPGKSTPFVSAPNPSTPSPSVTAKKRKIDVNVPLLAAAGVRNGEALYLAPSIGDPGGVHGFDPQQFQMLPGHAVKDSLPGNRGKPRNVKIQFGAARKKPEPAVSSVPVAAPTSNDRIDVTDDTATADQQSMMEPVAQARALSAEAGPDVLHAYSGYLLGHLIYPSYVTEGTFVGTTIATSPQFGLVAGVRAFGSGTVMFVNLPLTYLKGRTDALPMHGFLNYFAKLVLKSARLSGMPNGVPGITFNWHLDSALALQPMLALEKQGIFKNIGYSMHMTAGPDVITFGDHGGFDLPNNVAAQNFLKRMAALGHSVGSHGGWIHDYYGTYATEDNGAQFLQYLVLNRNAVDGVIGKPSRDYSAPQGNNPVWAMNWLASQGVVGAYFGGHTGLGMTRQYRDGVLMTPSLWVSPVTPFGNYATFEEFDEYNLNKQDVKAWYHDVVDFGIAQNTARQVYAHPPGAYDWLDVTKDFIAYVKSKGTAKFKWYTMERLADFLTKRGQVVWSEAPLANGTRQFTATHPTSLSEMVWLLPKDRYLRPTNLVGVGVSDGGSYWVVKAQSVATLSFRAKLVSGV